MPATLVSPAGGRRRAWYTFAPGLRSGNGTSKGWDRCCPLRGSVTWAAIPGDGTGVDETGVAGAGVPGAGTRVRRTEERILKGSARAVLLSCECCHLAGEVLDPLQKCGAVREWTNASEDRLGYDLGAAVRTEGCRVQATSRLEC
jgi:hypothetical protein